MISCDQCDKTFKKQGFLDRHIAKEHAGDAPPDSETEVNECELCTGDPVARLVAFGCNWPLCEDHLKVSLAFVEPL